MKEVVIEVSRRQTALLNVLVPDDFDVSLLNRRPLSKLIEELADKEVRHWDGSWGGDGIEVETAYLASDADELVDEPIDISDLLKASEGYW